MGNVLPYVEKIHTIGGILTDFGSTYSFDQLNYTGISYPASVNPLYGTATQNLVSSYYAQPNESGLMSAFGEITGDYVLNMTGTVPITIIHVPFFDSDGNEVFYYGIKITSLSEQYVVGTHTYKQVSVECAMYNMDDTIRKTLWTIGTQLGTYSNNDYGQRMVFASAFGEIESGGNAIKCFASGCMYTDNWGYGFNGYLVGDSFNTLIPYEVWGGTLKTYEVSESMGTPSEEESTYGGGSFDFSSDTIPLPDLPTVGVSTSGCVNVYKVTTGDLSGFINELFPPFNGINPTPFSTATSTLDALINLSDCFFNFVSNVFPLAEMWINKGLIDFVVDCHMIPCNVTTSTAERIVVGWKTFTQTASVVTDDYVPVSCGYLDIDECFGNFADYMSQCQLFLPFVGFVPAPPDLYLSEYKKANGRIYVDYTFNIIDGSFMVYVRCTSSKSELTDSVVAQYSGTCCVHLPITSTSYASLFSGALNGAVGIASSVASGNAVGVATSVANMAEMRPEKAGSNNYSASSNFLSVRTPFLLIARPSYYTSRDYVVEQGLPDYVTHKLFDLSGYTECQNPILDGFPIDDDEKEQLKQLLVSGIYL